MGDRGGVTEPTVSAWRSKALLAVLSAVAIWIWARPAMLDVNIFFSAAAMVGLGLDVVYQLARGAGERIFQILKGKTPAFCSLVSFVTAFLYAFVIAGDWGPVGFVPFVCYESFHLHHWLQALFCLSRTLAIFRCNDRRDFLAQSKISLVTAFILSGWGVACLLFPSLFWGNFSFVKIMVVSGFGFLVLGSILRTSEVRTKWFWVAAITILSVLFGVFANGVTGIFRDSMIEGKIPDSLVFFNDVDGCNTPQK